MSRKRLHRVRVSNQEDIQPTTNQAFEYQNISPGDVLHTQSTAQNNPNGRAAALANLSDRQRSAHAPSHNHSNHESDFNYEDETQDNAADSSQQKKVRGPTLLADIWNMPEGERILVKFNNRWQAIKREGRVLVSFLGTMARNPLIIPLHISDWRNFTKTQKENFLILVKKKFIIPKDGEKWVLKSLGKKWKDYKCELKSENFEKYRNVDELINNRPERIPNDQWTILASYWFSDKIKKRSDTNKRSRSKQKLPHTGGSKSIARLMDEMAENGEEPSRAKAFIATHRKRKDGRPIDIDSMERVEKMTEMLDELPNSIEQSRGNGAWEDDIYSKVMGPEPYGRVRGLGLGPTPKGLWGYSHQSEMPVENNTPTNEKVHRLEEELKAMEQRHVDEILTMKESQVRLESQISLLLSSFGMRVPQQPMTFRSNEILNEQVQSTSETHRPMHRPIA